MLKYPRPVTPADVSVPIRALCRELSDPSPFLVDVRAEADDPANDCFNVVSRQVESKGGKLVLGWSIWELPNVFVEAEFHAIWQSPVGDFVDLAKKKFATRRILFLPDSKRAYEGCQVDNVRRAISSDRILLAYFHALEKRFELLNRGDRKWFRGNLKLTGSDATELHEIETSINILASEVYLLYPYVSPYSPCVCGCGKKTKWCNGST